jgi:hypothetical protein
VRDGLRPRGHSPSQARLLSAGGVLGQPQLPYLPLEDALQLVRLYAERGSPKYEKAAMRRLTRYLDESSPRLQYFAEMTATLAALRNTAGALTIAWRSRDYARDVLKALVGMQHLHLSTPLQTH